MSPALALRGSALFGLGSPPATGDLKFITSASGTAVSSISIDGCFSAAYDHYLVMRDLLGSVAGMDLNTRLRVASVDASGANYRNQTLGASSTGVSGSRTTGATSYAALLGTLQDTSFGFSQTWISNPFAAVRTTAWANLSYDAGGNITMYSLVHEHDLTTSYDGFTVIPASGTITGTIYVYGLAV